MSSLSTNHCTNCKKLSEQIEKDKEIISNLRVKVIKLQDKLLKSKDDEDWYISGEQQKELAHKNRFKLFLGNIVPPVTKNLLINRIESSFGRVVEYCKDSHSPYAFVYFADANGYNAAISQGHLWVEGVNIRIGMPRPRKVI